MIRQLREEAEKTSSREFQADYLQRDGFRAEAVTELEATLDAVRKRIAELDQQQEAIRAEMLTP